MQSDNYPNLENICRLCLEENAATVDIFPGSSSPETLKIINRVSISMYIMACASLEVQPNDDLPKKICRNCRYQLEKAYCFRKISQASDAKLRKHLRLLNSGKVSRIFRNRNHNLSLDAITSNKLNIVNEDVVSAVKEHEKSNVSLHGDNNDSDDDDDDLENYRSDRLHDSENMTFVQIIDRERAQAEQQKRDAWCRMIKEEYDQKLKEEKENFEKKCWPQIKKKLELVLRKEIYNELKKTLELEIKEQCMKKARLQLRQEVQQECREEEMKSLLAEMEVFIKKKQGQQTVNTSQAQSVHIVRIQDGSHPEKHHMNQMHTVQEKPTDHTDGMNFELEDENTIINDLSDLRTVQIEKIVTTENDLCSRRSSLGDELKHILIKKVNNNDSEDINTTNRDEQDTENKVDYLIYDSEIVNDECENEQTFSHSALKILQDMDAGESHELVQILETDYDDMPTDSNDVSQDTTTSYHIDNYESGSIKVFKNSRRLDEADNNLEPTEEEGDVMIINLHRLDDIEMEDGELIKSEEVDEKKITEENKDISLEEIDEHSNSIKTTKRMAIKRKLILKKNNSEKTIVHVDDKERDSNEILDHSDLLIDNIKLKVYTSSLQRVTDTVKTFKCDECPIVFATQASLERHIKVHKKGGNYKCPECHIALSCKSALRRHMFVHANQKPFACNECGKTFVQREILSRHLLIHTGVKPYSCPHCDRSFAQRVNLKHHINRQHLEVPKIKEYPCHLCPKRFQHASGLSRHLASHGGLAFQCSECERTFGDRSSIKRHILNVHGKGRFEKSKSHN